MKAPIASGMNKRNENFAAFCFSIPVISAREIVIPDLDTPGKRASIWKRPIVRADLEFSFCFCFLDFVDSRMKPVKMNAMPRARYEFRAVSISGLNVRPKIIAGIVAMIKYSVSFFSFRVMMS